MSGEQVKLFPRATKEKKRKGWALDYNELVEVYRGADQNIYLEDIERVILWLIKNKYML